MISSKLVIDILHLILDDDEVENSFREQIDFLIESSKENTGIGLFINFENELRDKYFKIGKNLIFDGVEIKDDELNILADIILHIKDGIIDQLEIFNKNGEKYPEQDIEHYILKQNWKGSKNRTITKKAVI